MAEPFQSASVDRALAVAVFDSGPEWDAFVEREPDRTFCHLVGWRDVMADVLGHEPFYLVAVDTDGTWHGVMPMVRVRSRIFGHYLVSLPFLNYGGPLGSGMARRHLVAHALLTAQRLAVDLLEVRSRKPVEGLDLNVRKLTVMLPLPPVADLLWDALPSKLRSQIRRPMKEGYEVRFGPEQQPAFYEVFARNMRDLGTPVLPGRLFERLQEAFSDCVSFGVVYDGERPIAGGCGFLCNGELEMTWASDLKEYRRSAPNMMLYWSFMEHAIQRGAHTFNFGRCSRDSGTHRFKRQWGGEDVPLPWGQWSPRGLSATPSPDAAGFHLAARAWSRLPLALTNRLGPVLARRIP